MILRAPSSDSGGQYEAVEQRVALVDPQSPYVEQPVNFLYLGYEDGVDIGQCGCRGLPLKWIHEFENPMNLRFGCL